MPDDKKPGLSLVPLNKSYLRRLKYVVNKSYIKLEHIKMVKNDEDTASTYLALIANKLILMHFSQTNSTAAH